MILEIFKMQGLNNDRGVALLVVLAVITMLIAAALETNKKVRFYVVTTATVRDRVTLSHISSSGINVAMAMLSKEKKETSVVSLQQDWADSEKISEVLQDIPFENGNIKLKITDELSKIQANALVSYPEGQNFNESQKILWDRLVRQFISCQLFEDINPDEIINSVKDWLDSKDDDAITGLSGAESDYYQDLDPPYFCKNGPFVYLDELIAVKGITPELFYGIEEIAGISGYMTIYGATEADSGGATFKGKININTAELPVLKAILPSENDDLAQDIYDYREETSDSNYTHDLSSPTWYKNVVGLGDIEIDPELITTSSDFFKIESTASLHDMTMSITAVVHREKDKETGKYKCRVLCWQEE